jgi:TetR/AcrR family transcriptional regulator
MARPRADDPEARVKIMAAAEELFAARGYAGTAIRDIADGAGVNGAMIHYYFGNKEGLYHTLLESAAGGVRALLEDAIRDAQTSKERLTRFIEAYANYIFSRPNIARIMLREMLAGGPHLKEILGHTLGRNFTLIREVIKEGVRRGELRPIDADLTPLSLIGMIVFFQFAQPIIAIALGSHHYDASFLKRLSAHTTDLFLNGADGSAEGRGRKQSARAKRPAKKQSAKKGGSHRRRA